MLLEDQDHGSANAGRRAVASGEQQCRRGGKGLRLNFGIDDRAKTHPQAAVSSPIKIIASGASPATIIRAPRPS